jgi:isopentenyl diphosphate isomerase/L-lactate dehydrogenase-like FMN-dependent dehydrogenase
MVDIPASFQDLEKMAQQELDSEQFAFVSAGAGEGSSAAEATRAFERWRLVPHVLKDVTNRTTSTVAMGIAMAAPVMFAPVRGLRYIHPAGEVAAAKAASRLGLPLVLSNLSSTTMEEVALAMGDKPRLMQLYPCADEEVLRSFIARAERSGYSAIVLTVDMGGHSIQYRGPKTTKYDAFGSENYFSDPVFRSRLRAPPEKDRNSAMDLWRRMRESNFTWDSVRQIKGITRLPLALKGILHGSDVEEALRLGVSAIVVSNHGGRSADGEIGPMDVLPEVRDIVSGRVPILLDGSVRSGTDVIKAVALGASAVMVGRAYVYGLALGGEEGVIAVMSRVMKEIDNTLASCGCRSVSELDQSMVRHS